MGAGASIGVGPDGDGCGLGDLPEGCVAAVMLRLPPVEICRLARLSRAFGGAAASDFVWEAKLPANYRFLMGRAADDDESPPLRKKEVFARLCRFNFFDGGTKLFWLDKHIGGVFLAISAKALSITGIDDRRYWSCIASEESRFHSIAYLQQIWWFEVVGEIDFCFPPGTYTLFFRLHLGRASRRLGRRVCNLEHIHGWDIKPVRFELSTSDGQRAQSKCYLEEPGNWINYPVGDFVVDNTNEQIKVKFSMTQIDCTHTKGGLCVDSVLIYPKKFRQEKAPHSVYSFSRCNAS